MRTTLNLNEKLIEELLQVTEAKTKTAAIHFAISELIRRQKLTQLKSLSGRIHIDLNWQSRKKTEVESQKRLQRQYGHR